MTSSFLFLVGLLVGLVMTVTSGLMRRMTVHRLCHDITVPTPEHRSAFINIIAQRSSLPLVAFGLVGLLVRHDELRIRLLWAVVAALTAGLGAMFLYRDWKVTPPPVRAVVVREIPPNGFGQVQVEQGSRTLLLAAKSADGHGIPAGTAIEMVDCESSVLTVKAAGAAVSAA